MLQFIAQKLMNKKWLILSVVIGNILLVAIASCNPMYTKAALQKMLSTEMDNYLDEKNQYPGMISVEGRLSKTTLKKKSSGYFKDYMKTLETVRELYGVPMIEEVWYAGNSNPQDAHFEKKRENSLQNSLDLKLASLSNLQDHIEIISGEMYATTPSADGVIDVIVNEPVYLSASMIVGETIAFDLYTDNAGEPVRVRIAGVFRAKDEADIYWTKSALSYDTEMFMDQSLFLSKFSDGEQMAGNITHRWYSMFDYDTISVDNVSHMLEIDDKLSYDYLVHELYRVRFNYHSIFENYLKNSGRVVTTMWILQVPILVLLAVFIFMVSNQVISIEQSEISILKSRGVSKRQLLVTYFVQSAILAAVGFVIGLPFGYALCHLFGSTNAFLEFVGRKAMHVSITGTAVLYGLIVSVASIFIMTIPVLKYAKFTIVEQKANKRKRTMPLWQRMGLDFILLAISIYGFYNFNSQKALLMKNVAEGKALDPMLFLSASLFILSCAIVFLRVIPLLAALIFRIGRKLWKPASYASFLQIMRDIRKQNFITVFLVLTIALGIFNANIARTVNNNEETRICYNTGADLILQEEWKDNLADIKLGYANTLMYTEPDFARYEKLREENPDRIKGLAKVLVDDVTVNAAGTSTEGVQFMGINTFDFGSTAWMPEGVLPEHWYSYLNALSKNPEGAIISSNFAKALNLKEGDTVSIYRKDSSGKSLGRMTLSVVAIMDAFPSYESRVQVTAEDDTVSYADHYLVVGHFSNLSRYYPSTPYQVWMKVDGSTDFVYDWIETNKISLRQFEDTNMKLIDMKNNPYFQVTNGMLTITFIVVLVLCAIGFLIYWLTNIRSRELIFGIYRAMGMSMGELIRMLVNEHFFGSLLPILFGAGIGVLASKMFIPLIEIAYSPAERTLPASIYIAGGDIARISVVVGLMLVGCLFVISVLLSKIKINQALKLGED
ncbi:MAG: FtsX-like permease family protein [Lachnospiraceae bacterium]|nr:FtsX-like permease family protein [Lachnospiraceae bacterium]